MSLPFKIRSSTLKQRHREQQVLVAAYVVSLELSAEVGICRWWRNSQNQRNVMVIHFIITPISIVANTPLVKTVTLVDNYEKDGGSGVV